MDVQSNVKVARKIENWTSVEANSRGILSLGENRQDD